MHTKLAHAALFTAAKLTIQAKHWPFLISYVEDMEWDGEK